MCFSRSLLITYLVTLSLEKEIIFLEESLQRVLNYGSKNLYQTWLNISEQVYQEFIEQVMVFALTSTTLSFI